MALTDKLTAIGDAIRGKTGKTEPLTLDQMATEIGNIQAGGGGDSSLLDSVIDKSIEGEIVSNALEVGYATFYWTWIERAIFPQATYINDWAFYNASLEYGYFPEVTQITQEAFYGNPLTEIYLPKVKDIGTGCFESCSNLEEIDLPALQAIRKRAFANCSSLKTVILRKNKVCSLVNNNEAFDGCPHFTNTKDGYFYVPAAYVSDYESHSNWGVYAGQFRALEDYTVDGTITGELDRSKI